MEAQLIKRLPGGKGDLAPLLCLFNVTLPVFTEVLLVRVTTLNMEARIKSIIIKISIFLAFSV